MIHRHILISGFQNLSMVVTLAQSDDQADQGDLQEKFGGDLQVQLQANIT